MAPRIIESQVIQVGRDLRWSVSPAWVVARVLISQEECFAFLLIECEEDLWPPVNQFLQPTWFSLNGRPTLGISAGPASWCHPADLKRVHASTSSKCLTKVLSRTGPTSLLTGLQTKCDPLTITVRGLSSQQSFTSGCSPLQSVMF